MTDDNQESTGQDSQGSQPPLPTINFATFIFHRPWFSWG